jgi:hypothetical protein
MGECVSRSASSRVNEIIVRKTVIGGRRWPDDFTVIWRGLPKSPTTPPEGNLSAPSFSEKATGKVAF